MYARVIELDICIHTMHVNTVQRLYICIYACTHAHAHGPVDACTQGTSYNKRHCIHDIT